MDGEQDPDLKSDDEEDGRPPAASASQHTSIIYFHGMGTPKRYEELCRVLDTLDRYAEAQGDPSGLGRLRGQLVQLENSRVGGDEPIAYIEFFRQIDTAPKGTKRIGAFRLYESYWSPAAAGGVSPAQVATWALRRTLNPFKVLFSPWRAHQRLKLTFLHRLYYDRKAQPVKWYQMLARAYRTFESMEYRRQFPKGGFDEYLKFVATQAGVPPVEGLIALAERWRHTLIDSQLSVVLIATAVLGVLFSAATLAVTIVLRILALSVHMPTWLHAVVMRSNPISLPILLLAAIVLGIAGRFSGAFFRNFLSDVVFWTTTFEKDLRYQKRRDILRAAENTVRHVLNDPQCGRVVIVAHSLGTAIAYETLLNLGRRYKAEARDSVSTRPGTESMAAQFPRLSHFITFGSPIDRISYFFNLTYSRYHRFNRVVDDLMGNTGDPPFLIRKKRTLQWINVRDLADPISSRLFSPRGRIPNREDIVEVAVASSHIPDPVRAHTGYFDAWLSAKILFDACILDRRQVQAQQERTKISQIFAPLALHLGRISTLLVIGGMTVSAIAFWSNSPLVFALGLIVLGVGAVALCIVITVGAVLDQRQPLKLPA